jgi:hypothetical protein
MNNDQIIKKLETLRAIRPDKDFSQKSRLLIIQTPFTPSKQERISFEAATAGLRSFTVADLFSNTFRSIMIASATLAILGAIYFATAQLSPLFLPGLNKNGIVAEASMVNSTINVQLDHVNRFEQTSKDSVAALREVAANTPSHLNASIISGEQSKIESLSPSQTATDTNQQINDILKQISQ